MEDSPVSARLLDLTRLMSRAGRVLTGIDRVELAYLKDLLTRAKPSFGLVRTPLGYLLLDKAGLQGFADRIEGRESWGEASRLSRVFSKLDKTQRRALSDLRRLAIARTNRRGLGKMLKRQLPADFAYLNVGHSNLNDRVVHGVKHGGKGRVTVMIHDTIPLDYPLFQTPDAVERFRNMLRRVRAQADLVIYNSYATRTDAERYMGEWGEVPQGIVAHLGVELADPAPTDLPDGLPPERPYFVSVGTIEPRKNHALLIRIWEQMAEETPPQDMPHLVICGSRGWLNEELFRRIDGSALTGVCLHEQAGLSDGAIAALLDRAAGALYPSLAEGYGLPMIEAAARGVPVVCADLAVYREVLGDIPVYASPKDSYLWQRTIKALASGRQAGSTAESGSGSGAQAFVPASWTQHFNKVFRLT